MSRHRRFATATLLLLLLAPLVPASGVSAARSATGAMARCPAPDVFTGEGVTIGLEATFAPGEVISIGLPLPPGAVRDARTLAVRLAGEPVAATVTPLLPELDGEGATVGVRSLLIQFPAELFSGPCGLLDVRWTGGDVTVESEPVPFAAVSAPSDEVVETAAYTIVEAGGEAALVASDRQRRILFTAREPAVLPLFPAGYLAASGLLGPQVAATALGPDLAGLAFISEQVTPFGLSAMYQERYPINAEMVVDPTDPDEGYEAWLYDRCATFLVFAVHTGDPRFLREGYRTCAYYADSIELEGENRGIFTGKPEPDPKYSHLRGLFAYYALTGDEAALAAGVAIAERFLADETFVAPYRAGHLPGVADLWTERLLAVSLEALIYGHLLTGEATYLAAVNALVATAYRHVTGDVADLARINPGATPFPPQNCFIHTAEQAAEGDASMPWCSGWMPALLVDPLLVYQAQTGDERVDEIFVRLTRYLRDVGTAYFTGGDDANEDDTFLRPAVASAPPGAEDQRLLVPLYGAGLDAGGRRINAGEYDDFQHCLDATAITAAGLRALKRSGGYDANPIGPFASEGDSFLALHEELLFCAEWMLAYNERPHRDPATWTADALAEGLSDPATFISENNIGNVSHNLNPARKISWWFNPALAQFALLTEADIAIPELHPGQIQPGG